jgi:hypothetical protein
MNYEKLIREFLNYDCRLLSNKMELEGQNKSIHHTIVKIVATCGHEHECVVNNFLNRRTAILCKDCCLQNVKKMYKNEQYIDPFETEYKGYVDLKKILERSSFEVEKTKEGCRADFMIKVKDSSESRGVGVQLKVTRKVSFRRYTFRNVHKSYENLLMFCYCLEDRKLWLFPFSEIKDLKDKLKISERSKYNKFLVDKDDNIHSLILSYRCHYGHYLKEELLVPTALSHQLEQMYARKRQEYLPFLSFSYPKIENGKTDFYVGDLKFQEKIAGKQPQKSHIIRLSVNNGKIDGKKQYRTYCVGENDFYWIHIKDTTQFYVIPESELYERQYISDKNKFMKKVNINVKNNQDWLGFYFFDYGKLDKDRLQVLLGI